MPRFLIERDFGVVSDEEMEAVTARSHQLMAERFPEIVWEHSHVCGDADGRVTTA